MLVCQDMVDSQLDAGSSYGRSQTPFQVFMAKYSYDPEQYSPNDNPDVELALTAGDYLFVYGEMDEVRQHRRPPSTTEITPIPTRLALVLVTSAKLFYIEKYIIKFTGVSAGCSSPFLGH